MTIKTWFITGASSGFGRQFVEQLLANGHRVTATVRKADALADLKASYGDRLRVGILDITDTENLRKTVNEAFAEMGRIDVVVSNAGYGLFGAAEELTDAQIRAQIDTNLIGSIQLARAVIPHLRRQGAGRILQLSSMGGQIALPALSLYHATKWAVEGFYESVAQEVTGFNIQVTLVEPGSARTNFSGTSAVQADVMQEYETGPVGEFRRKIASPSFRRPGDPARMVAAMIKCALSENPPRRLVLGSDAYTRMQAILCARLAAIESQRESAFATDTDD
ncbi:MAG: SDR family oxidoreductase [Azonexaceae bacterium]|nr:SDR family oxidoreductase [Azonexaceae bacterium]